MSVEVLSYRLTYKGKPVGTHVLKAQTQGRFNLLEAHTQFQGVLGPSTVIQRSRSHSSRYLSDRFQEETNERTGQRTFDVRFDSQSGLVTATRGPRDHASMPYIQPYRDPLSLLWELRSLGDEEHTRVPMVGKDVDVRRVGVVELETAIGTSQAYAYVLHPGGSIVYVDVREPHRFLKFTQRLADGIIDSVIVKASEEAELHDWQEPEGDANQGGSKPRKRSRRRRPRRGKRRD